uniref:Uncharacterized protein n=1 Tax=Leersia perrieri TaxID=77586 RepID=A0A0D9XLE2_9ORYZ
MMRYLLRKKLAAARSVVFLPPATADAGEVFMDAFVAAPAVSCVPMFTPNFSTASPAMSRRYPPVFTDDGRPRLPLSLAEAAAEGASIPAASLAALATRVA